MSRRAAPGTAARDVLAGDVVKIFGVPYAVERIETSPIGNVIIRLQGRTHPLYRRPGERVHVVRAEGARP